MKDDNKYYIPDISEFHIGFEFEVRDAYRSKGVDSYNEYRKETIKGLNWMLTADWIEKCCRVKYLDRDDIESLGFIPEDYEGSLTYKLGKYRLFWYEGLVISIEKISLQVYRGYCKNKSELVFILKRLGAYDK